MEKSNYPGRSGTRAAHRQTKTHSYCNVRCGLRLMYLFYIILKWLEYEEMFVYGKHNETTSFSSNWKKKNYIYIFTMVRLELQSSRDVLNCSKCESTRPFFPKGRIILLLHAISSYGIWSKGLGGCDHAWKSSLNRMRKHLCSKAEDQIYSGLFLLALLQVKALTTDVYSDTTLYPRMFPFCCGSGTGPHVTSTCVELMASAVTFSGAPDGTAITQSKHTYWCVANRPDKMRHYQQ